MVEHETFSEKPIIKVVGVGGGGGNALNRMIENDVKGVEFISINTDSQVLRLSKSEYRMQIGKQLTKGLGAGADPSVGEKAAIENEEEIKDLLRGSNMVFVTAGMGGGTGTGAAPIVAKIAQELGCLTVAIVTKPFTFEGKRRMQQAEEGIEKLRQYVDALIVIPNDKILGVIEPKTSMLEAFKQVDNVLRRSVQGITEIVTIPGIINIDFADVRKVLKAKGTSALMGIGVGEGENRAIEAARKAISTPLLEIDINGATQAIVFITSDVDISFEEVMLVMNEIRSASTSEIDIVYGTGFNMDLRGELIVTVVATGYPDDEQEQKDVDSEDKDENKENEDETKKIEKPGEGGKIDLPKWII